MMFCGRCRGKHKPALWVHPLLVLLLLLLERQRLQLALQPWPRRMRRHLSSPWPPRFPHQGQRRRPTRCWPAPSPCCFPPCWR